MPNGPQVTLLSLKIGKLFVAEPHRRRWNYQIAKDVGTDPANSHGILADMERRGWIRGVKEYDNGSMGRAARKLYGLTGTGAEAIGALLKPLQLASS